MARILIVDDSVELLAHLKELLSTEGHDVFEAKDGITAQELVKIKNPQLVLSDIKMPAMNGIELLHWIRQNAKANVVLMTSFSDIIEGHEAIELGATDLLLKPFDFNQLKAVLKRVLGSSDKKDQQRDDEFLKIDLKHFISGRVIPCAIYIRLKENRYVKLANAGDGVPQESLERYKENNLRHLHVRKDEYRNFVGYNLNIAKAIVEKKDKIDPEKIQNFLRYTGEVVLEDVFVLGMDREAFNEVKQYAITVLELTKDDNDMIGMLMAINDHSDALYAHSMATAMYCVMIAKQVGWNTEPTLFKVFMAGLIHDIGLKELDPELITKPRILMSSEEIKVYETHPARGMEVLNTLGTLPDEVVLAAYQHHEDCLGQGYPRKLKKHKITPISRLVHVADMFCQKRLTGDKDFLSQLRAVVKEAENLRLAQYDSMFFQAFKRVLNIS